MFRMVVRLRFIFCIRMLDGYLLVETSNRSVEVKDIGLGLKLGSVCSVKYLLLRLIH